MAIDPFARAMPGQSLTDTPGLRPYEKPPTSADPEQVIDALESSLKEEDSAEEIAELLDIGISVETVCIALMQKCFTEGMCSPDVAELVKPALFMIIVQIGSDKDIMDMVLFNEKFQKEGLSDEKKLRVIQQLHPKKYQKIMDSVRAIEFEEEQFQEHIAKQNLELDAEELNSLSEEMGIGTGEAIESPMEESESPGSFLNMEVEEPASYEEEMI